ncbi:MAG: arylsulfatase [Bryobacterales bacterium]|nr:arylsulfatase [Bryobacterales bacterium]
MELTRRGFLQMTGAAAMPQASPRKPNFLIILADDMGYSDARCYGGEIDTPNLDRLAAGGLRFTQGYSTARCGPSRSCILTGRYSQQTSCDVMSFGSIPEWTRFAPQYLKPLGYRSYQAGKWHIRFKPLAGAGFDHAYTVMDLNRYFTPRQHLLDDQELPAVKPGDGYYMTKAIGDHAVRMLKQHAAEHAQDPFYFYLAFNAPHFPLHALQEDIERYKDKFAEGWDVARERRWQRMRKMGLVNCELSKLETGVWPPWNTSDAELTSQIGPGEVTRAVPWNSLTAEQKKFQRLKMAIHAAMITRMDMEIGRVLDQVKVAGQLDNTVVVFVSDNGASAELLIRADGHDATAPAGSAASHLCLGPGWSSAGNSPFRLHKSWVHEGGIASPYIVHWPNGIKAKGELRQDPCHLVDIVPTMVELGGGKPDSAVPAGAPAFAGKSLAPAFAKDGVLRREYLYFHHNNNRAVRVGDMKLVAAGKSGPWELYDLRKDRAESRNLIGEQPAVARKLGELWQSREDEFNRVRESAKPVGADGLMPGSKPVNRAASGSGKR